MLRTYLGTVRGQLVLWYLSVLAILLLVVGVVQSITLTQYLRTSTASSLEQSAHAELRVLGPCFVHTAAQLNAHAGTLAQFLGSRDTAVKIVTPSGETLANRSFGLPGHFHVMRLPATTIVNLIQSANRANVPDLTEIRGPSCQGLAQSRAAVNHVYGASGGPGFNQPPPPVQAVLNEGDLVLVAIPLGLSGQTVGYALLGRSFADAASTIQRTELVFAVSALAVLLLAAIVALPLINRALLPLRRIADTAGAIAGGDLQQRANLTHSPDEIGRLGKAFDTMVDQLEAALTTANQSEERMRRFLADASHELRTPITVLRGTSEILLRHRPTDQSDLTGALKDMNEEAVRLSRLVDDLLTLSRLDAGLPLNPEPVQVRPFLEHFADRYGNVWPSRQIQVETGEIDGATAYVDPEALRRIVTNLVDNAAQYSTRGGTISLGGQSDARTVTVLVSDAGPGLSQEDAARVFERFYRGAKSRSRGSGGTGLGLAIVQALAKESGGSVRIDTAPTRGTTIAITLPRSEL